MQRIQLQGRASTLRDQQRTNFSRPDTYSVVDLSSVKTVFSDRMFCGPIVPIEMLPQFTPDAESIRYWRMVRDFELFAYCEFESRGTLPLATHMGY